MIIAILIVCPSQFSASGWSYCRASLRLGSAEVADQSGSAFAQSVACTNSSKWALSYVHISVFWHCVRSILYLSQGLVTIYPTYPINSTTQKHCNVPATAPSTDTSSLRPRRRKDARYGAGRLNQLSDERTTSDHNACTPSTCKRTSTTSQKQIPTSYRKETSRNWCEFFLRPDPSHCDCDELQPDRKSIRTAWVNVPALLLDFYSFCWPLFRL